MCIGPAGGCQVAQHSTTDPCVAGLAGNQTDLADAIQYICAGILGVNVPCITHCIGMITLSKASFCGSMLLVQVMKSSP